MLVYTYAKRAAIIVGVLALILLPPVVLPTSRLLHVAIMTVILAMVAQGLALLYGDVGQMSVAHGALWGAGAYGGALWGEHFGGGFWAAVLAGMAASTLAACLVGYPSLRIRGHYFLIVSFAFAELFRVVMANLEITGKNQGILLLETLPFGETLEGTYRFVAVLLVVVSATVVIIRRSSMGRTFRAVRENAELATAVGTDVGMYKVVAFAISGTIAGLAGVVYAYYIGHIAPELFGAFPGIQFVLMILLGGSLTIIGPVVGAAAVGFLPEALQFDPITTQIAYGVILVVIVLFMPEGIVQGVGFRGRDVLLALSRWWGNRAPEPDGIGHPRGPIATAVGPEPDLLATATTTERASRPALPETGPRESDRPLSRLEVSEVWKKFGGVTALRGVSVATACDEILGIIGPNGSGKTTLLNVVAGSMRPNGGEVAWNGQNISGRAPHRIARAGIGRTYQGTMVFGVLSTEENVRFGWERRRHAKGGRGIAWQSPTEVLEYFQLAEYRAEPAGELPYGHQKMLGLAIALAAGPDLLLMDEPAAGLNHAEADVLRERVAEIHRAGMGVIMVDHNMGLMMQACDRLLVLNFGEAIAIGTPAEVRSDPVVVEAYLGHSLAPRRARGSRA